MLVLKEKRNNLSNMLNYCPFRFHIFDEKKNIFSVVTGDLPVHLYLLMITVQYFLTLSFTVEYFTVYSDVDFFFLGGGNRGHNGIELFVLYRFNFYIKLM